MADYYELLGVDRDANGEQIKKAYRKLALRYHPDRNQGSADAEDRFKEATKAYEVLRDPDRRASYDRFGEAGIRGTGSAGQSGFGFQDIQSAMDVFMRDFGGMGGFGDVFGFGGSRGRRSGPTKGESVRIRVKLSLSDIVGGVRRRIRLSLLDVCDRCSGSGDASGTRSVCGACGGSGEIRHVQRSMLGQMVSVQPCRTCGGEGRTVSDPCRSCSGEGRTRVEHRMDVEVPAGVTSDNYLTLRGRGNVGPRGGPRGDVVVMLEVEDDPRFERDGTELTHNVTVTFAQAALGDEIEVPTLEGTARVRVPAGVQGGDVLRMKGLGLPELHGRNRGDQLLHVRVWTPERLNRDQQEAFEQLRQVEGEVPTDLAGGPRTRRGLWEWVKGALAGS